MHSKQQVILSSCWADTLLTTLILLQNVSAWPITAWSTNQRGQWPSLGNIQIPPYIGATWLQFLFLVSRPVYHCLLSVWPLCMYASHTNSSKCDLFGCLMSCFLCSQLCNPSAGAQPVYLVIEVMPLLAEITRQGNLYQESKQLQRSLIQFRPYASIWTRRC